MDNHDVNLAMLADSVVKELEEVRSAHPFQFGVALSMVKDPWTRDLALGQISEDVLREPMLKAGTKLGYHRDATKMVVAYTAANKGRVVDAIIVALEDVPPADGGRIDSMTPLIECLKEALNG